MTLLSDIFATTIGIRRFMNPPPTVLYAMGLTPVISFSALIAQPITFKVIKSVIVLSTGTTTNNALVIRSVIRLTLSVSSQPLLSYSLTRVNNHKNMIYSVKVPRVRCRVAIHFPNHSGRGLGSPYRKLVSLAHLRWLWLFRSFVSFSRSVQLKKRSVSTYVVTAANCVSSLCSLLTGNRHNYLVSQRKSLRSH